jgi:sodium/hydrogen antiporter
MLNTYLAVIGLLAIVVTLISKRIRSLPLSEPMLALAVGILIGPKLLGFVDLHDPGSKTVLLQASRLLLAVSLMAIAVRYPLSEYRKRVRGVVLLIVVVMPGMAAIPALLGGWLLGLPAATAWLVGACVSPTDPVLASSVVTGESAKSLVPARVRQLLSAESGANDGLAFPLVVLGIVLVVGEPLSTFAFESLYGVLAAVAIGVVVGLAGSLGVNVAERDGDLERSVSLLFTVALALCTLGVAKLANTDGILAIFAAGLAYNATSSGQERAAENSIDEGVNRFVVLPLFTLFGVALPWELWGDMGWNVALFAVGVLLLRRLPLIAALKRPLGLRWPGTLFYGWFGPIGVSALFYLVFAHEEGVTDPRIFAAGSAVITASVLAHGVSAATGRRWYGRHVDEEPDRPEPAAATQS